jgi:iron(III) transport system substrate-binding protein
MYAQNMTEEPLTLVHGLDRTRSIWINRDLLPETEVATVEDLLKPQLRGRMLIDNPGVPAGGSVALSAILRLKGEDFLRQLMVDQRPVYLDDAALAATWLAEGRYPVAIGPDTNRIEQLKAAGVGRSARELTAADSGALMASGASVFRNAPHPNATRVFLNWLWSQEGQAAWSRAMELNSRRNDVPPFEPASLPDYERLDAYVLLGTQQGSALLNEVMSLYQAIR